MSAYVNEGDVQAMDTLTAVPVATVRGSELKPGMVLVDPELSTPLAEVDHRNPTIRSSGQARYLVFMYDSRTWEEIQVGHNSAIKVMAR